jgi:hypothetical protein
VGVEEDVDDLEADREFLSTKMQNNLDSPEIRQIDPIKHLISLPLLVLQMNQ